MPAIDIARLKTQSAVLVEKFDQPDLFIQEFHQIMEKYADRTIRMGIMAAHVSVLPGYPVPPPVLRQIEMELTPLAATFPEQAINLTDHLWKDGQLESRLLAANLIGRIDPNTPLLLERIVEWTKSNQDDDVRLALLGNSLTRVRRETSAKFLQLLREWLDPLTPKMWGNAIHAIIPLVEDSSFQNLPPVYDALSPVIKIMPSIMQNDLADLINALYKASPYETTHFLRQVIIGASSPQLPITLRRILPQLPAGLRPIILDLVRKKSFPD